MVDLGFWRVKTAFLRFFLKKLDIWLWFYYFTTLNCSVLGIWVACVGDSGLILTFSNNWRRFCE